MSTSIARRAGRLLLSPRSRQFHRQFITRARQQASKRKIPRVPTILLAAGVLVWLDSARIKPESQSVVPRAVRKLAPADDRPKDGSTAWLSFTKGFESLSNATDIEWATISDRIVDYVLPEWSKLIPVYIRKLQQDLSGEPGSLAEDIWRQAHDPALHPEIQYSAHVRVSSALCDDEKEFLARRKRVTKVALARYLGISEDDIHPDDVPVIAVCGSGGGLRALVAGAGSLLAAHEDGLLDCITYTAGVSGSCWLQALHFSSIGRCSVQRVLDHLKGRTTTHIAYPPVALQTLVSAPTDRYLLSGVVEKLKGDGGASFGLVDIYGILLAARLLVPVGDLEVDDGDLKISSQREYVKFGQNPLPIYTAVRHEIPEAKGTSSSKTATVSEVSEEAKREAKDESWFQWFEMTPYELFCEEFSAGIPTWAVGRKFENGINVLPEDGVFHPEIRTTLLLGVFGSAFCATLSHYYQEIRPIVRGLTGFGALDELITGRNGDLSKVHPIDPATLPNFAYGMDGKLPETTPQSIYKHRYLQLMDAGMSNNLPIYPLVRPGRGVDIIIAFDNSADTKQDNWLAVTDGYCRQRNIRGWPVGAGWPKEEAVEEGQMEANTSGDSTPAPKERVAGANFEDYSGQDRHIASTEAGSPKTSAQKRVTRDLGYCTTWVGTIAERTSSPPPPSKALDSPDSPWHELDSPTAGLALIYLPLLPNPRVPGVDPRTTDFLSTWNFVYTPDQVQQVVDLAKANYDEGRENMKRCVRAVYERRKALREEKEKTRWENKYRSLVRKGVAHKLGEGDHFS